MYLLASYAKKNSLHMQTAAYLVADGKALLKSAQDNAFAKTIFGSEFKKWEELVYKIRTRKKICSDYEMQELAKSFTGQYEDPWNGVDHFVQYVKECCEKYRAGEKYFAPCIALVQCSGSGKSRMLLESSKRLRTLYVCFRSGATGYPPRTKKAIIQLFGGTSLEDAKDEAAYEQALVERLRLAEISARTHLAKPGMKSSYSESAMFESEELCESVWNLQSIDLNAELPDSDEPVLLVLDEARALLDLSQDNAPFGVSRFRLFRRALAKYWATYRDAKLFAVMVDTSSKIRIFAPSLDADPSARQVRDEGGSEVLHPYVWRGSFDAIFHSKKLPGGTRDLTPLLNNLNYLLAGRPLVGIPFSDPIQQKKFLLRKLRGGLMGGTPQTGQNLAHLSIVLSRLATSISCLSTTPAELVAEHMVHLLASDISRDHMFVSHLAEPRLALAAALAWNTAGELETKLLPALQSALISGVVSAGDHGEIVAQVVLNIAFDAACLGKNKNPGEIVPLIDFLEQLLPEDSKVDVRDAIPPSLRDASIACGQFVLLAHHLSLDTHLQLAERHCGAMFKARQPGVDAVVPIIAPVSAMTTFQFKNVNEQGRASASVCSAMNPSFAWKNQKIPPNDLLELDKNCVRVYMQLGANAKSACCNVGGPLEIYGLSPRCLSEPVARALEMLLDASNSIESYVLAQKAASKEGVPFPDDVSTLRQILPFVIDSKPQWNDLTVVELKLICKKNGITGYSDYRKQRLIDELIQVVGKEPVD
jgi:hypothetical protein